MDDLLSRIQSITPSSRQHVGWSVGGIQLRKPYTLEGTVYHFDNESIEAEALQQRMLDKAFERETTFITRLFGEIAPGQTGTLKEMEKCYWIIKETAPSFDDGDFGAVALLDEGNLLLFPVELNEEEKTQDA